jgi:hypothetical protein
MRDLPGIEELKGAGLLVRAHAYQLLDPPCRLPIPTN